MGEIKQTNFRVDQETADAFRQFCEANGMNQAQGFDHVMQVVEIDRAKAATPGRITEIEAFEKSVKDIMAAYLTSVEITNTTEVRVKEQFASDLTRKDKTIDALQSKVEELKSIKDSAMSAQQTAEDMRAAAEEREKNAAEQMESAKKLADEKERINAMLSSQLAEATEKLAGYDDLRNQCVEYKHQNDILNTKLADAEAVAVKYEEIQKSEKELKEEITKLNTALLNQTKDAELEKERAVSLKEKEMTAQISQMEHNKVEAVSAEREKWNVEIAKVREEMEEKIAQLREEKARLIYQIEVFTEFHKDKEVKE